MTGVKIGNGSLSNPTNGFLEVTSNLSGTSIWAEGAIQSTNDVRVNSTSVCLKDGTNCPASSGFTYSSYFDQPLNTTSSVMFRNITVTEAIMNNGGVALSNEYYFETLKTECMGNSNFAPFSNAAVSSGTVSTVTSANSTHPGLVSLRDSTTAGGGYYIGTTSTSAIQLQGGECGKLIFYDVADRVNASMKFGFFDSYTYGTNPTDACFFRLNSSTNIIGAECRNNSVAAGTTVNYTITNTKFYRATVCIDSAAYANFSLYEMGSTIPVWTQAVTSSIPIATTGRQTGFAVAAFENSADAAADITVVDYLELSMKQRLNR